MIWRLDLRIVEVTRLRTEGMMTRASDYLELLSWLIMTLRNCPLPSRNMTIEVGTLRWQGHLGVVGTMCL